MGLQINGFHWILDFVIKWADSENRTVLRSAENFGPDFELCLS